MTPDPVGVALDGGVLALLAAYRNGLDPVAVVDEVLARIDAADDPAVWIDVEPAESLRATAKEAAQTPMEGRPLHGVPFAVKDNINVDGRVTTTGLPGAASTATATATVVARLVAAGGIYVGKTNLDQLATGLVGTRSPYGVPRNPFDAALIPGGSSSGSAVAVATGVVPFSLGTDTAGSGRVPAAMCGIVGLKSAPGRLPTDGVVPASPTLDCVSTFARSVADGLAVESVMAGSPWPVASGPFRVAVADGVPPETVDILAAAGDVVVPVDVSLFFEAGDLLYAGPWLADRTAALRRTLDADPSGLDEVVRTVVDRGMAYRGVEVFAAIDRLREIRRELATWWTTADVLVVPTIPFVPTLAEVAEDPIGLNAQLGRFTTFANLLGLTAITVPAASGPGGVTVLGPPGAVGAVAAVAGAFHCEDLRSGAGVAGERILLAVVGAHLRGQPLNGQMVDAGAELVATTTTSDRYRLFRLEGGPPVRPGLERVGVDQGRAIEVEVWAVTATGLGSVLAGVAPPLGIGSVELADGRWVKGFICESIGIAGARDITEFGGWRAFLASEA